MKNVSGFTIHNAGKGVPMIFNQEDPLTSLYVARFWAYVKKTKGCWLWTAAVANNGYGVYKLGDFGCFRAHRLAYVLENGPIKEGLLVCHRCDVKLCVNPRHLYAATHHQNMSDASSILRSFMPGHPRYSMVPA